MKICSVEGCEKPIKGRGYCCMHYNRLMRYGDINTIRQNKAGLAKKYPEMAQVLYGIKQRCTNPNEANYKFYGGRGIKVCDRWLDKVYGLQNFINDMGIRPTGKTPQGRAFWSIDRIDKDGDYCPENCKWSTWWEQAKNQRSSLCATGLWVRSE